MEIVVIDDGVSELCFREIGTLARNMVVTDNFCIEERVNYNRYALSHGTVCAGIIKKYSTNAQISSMKVIDNYSTGNKDKLFAALNWCLLNDVKLINLSLGTRFFLDFNAIRDACNQLLDHGCVIVAAASNDGSFTMPANMTGVIGVKCTKEFEHMISFNEVDLYEPPIKAPGMHRLIKSDGQIHVSLHRNSYAVPYVCAVVHNMMQMDGITKANHVFRKLYECYGNGRFYDCLLPGFMQRPLLVDPDATFCADSLFYHWRKKNGTFSQASWDDDSLDIVIIPSEKELDERMKIHSLQIRSIMVAGHMTPDIMELVHSISCMVWTEEAYCKRIQETAREISRDPSIPIVMVNGNIEDIELLFDKYTQDGYSIKIVSDIDMAYLYGVDYMTEEVSMGKYFALLEQKFNCDMILFWSSRFQKPEGVDLFILLKSGISPSEVNDVYSWMKDKLTRD